MRKLGAPNLDMLDKIDTAHLALRNHSENAISNFYTASKTHLADSDDDI